MPKIDPKLLKALEQIVKPEVLAAWFDTPNPAFDGLKPIELIERGESDRLWQMAYELSAGMHT